MRIPIPNPLLLLALLLPLTPPVRNPPDTRVKHSDSQDDDDVARNIDSVTCEIEAQATVDQTKEKDGGTEVFVDLGEFGRRLGLLPCAVVEKA